MSNVLKLIAGGAACAAVVGLGALALSGGNVSAQPADHGQCFLASNLNGFSAPNDHTVYVRVGVNEVYRLDLMGECTDLRFKQSFGLESAGGDPWICNPLQATVVFHDVGIPSRCPVSAMHKLTPDEVAALPKGDIP